MPGKKMPKGSKGAGLKALAKSNPSLVKKMGFNTDYMAYGGKREFILPEMRYGGSTPKKPMAGYGMSYKPAKKKKRK